jgi:Fe-S cluster assembly ATP-binding protein
MTETLEIKNLHVAVEGKKILNGVDLVIHRGETHALMGPNGSGKSTLAGVIMGHPNYEITEGTIELNGQDILEWDASE